MKYPRYHNFVLVGLATLLIALASPTAAVVAQTATPPVFNGIDVVIDSYLPRIANYQGAYVLGHGRYFQGLWSHGDAPDEAGQPGPPDRLTARPTDQLEGFGALWNDIHVGQGNLPFRFRVDTYDGPGGKGYVVTVQVRRLGELYERVVNVGPEGWRESGWTLSLAGAEAINR